MVALEVMSVHWFHYQGVIIVLNKYTNGLTQKLGQQFYVNHFFEGKYPLGQIDPKGKMCK